MFDDFDTQVQSDEVLDYGAWSEEDIEEFHRWLDMLSVGWIEEMESGM
jgi:hypothetical protein